MSYNNIKELFTDICNSIREKTGETGLINHTDIPQKIAAIETGGGTGVIPEVNNDYMGYCSRLTNSETINSKLNEIVQHINQTNDFLELFDIFYYVDNLNFDFSLFRDRVVSSSYMFDYYLDETIPNIEKLDTSNIIDMSRMFNYCKNLTNINLSNFNTSKCKYMNYMFFHCDNLTSVDLSNFDTTNLREYSNIFSYCSNLQYLKLGKNFCPYSALNVSLFNSSTYQDIEIDMDGNTNFANFGGPITLNLTTVWRGTDETKIARFISFANSLGVKSVSNARTIKIYTNLYNTLTDAQKELITSKGYALSYGTS